MNEPAPDRPLPDPPMPDESAPDDDAAALRGRLDASRADLLGSLEGLTERDFARRTPEGERIVDVLAGLAGGERAAARAARLALGLPARDLPRHEVAADRVLPPQAVHDLAGARYETTLVLDALGDQPAAEEALRALAAVVDREHEAARAIRIAAGRDPGETRPA